MTDQLPEPLDVIAVGAHPDDVEIGCGGTLAKLVSQGFRVGVVDITDGEPTPQASGPEERLAEATNALSRCCRSSVGQVEWWVRVNSTGKVVKDPTFCPYAPTHPASCRELQHHPDLVGVDAGLRVQQHVQSLTLK